jgi:hypothetical protein
MHLYSTREWLDRDSALFGVVGEADAEFLLLHGDALGVAVYTLRWAVAQLAA